MRDILLARETPPASYCTPKPLAMIQSNIWLAIHRLGSTSLFGMRFANELHVRLTNGHYVWARGQLGAWRDGQQ
jgi:hypothetical protein